MTSNYKAFNDKLKLEVAQKTKKLEEEAALYAELKVQHKEVQEKLTSKLVELDCKVQELEEETQLKKESALQHKKIQEKLSTTLVDFGSTVRDLERETLKK